MQGSWKLRGYMPCSPTHPAQEAAPREAVAPEQQGREAGSTHGGFADAGSLFSCKFFALPIQPQSPLFANKEWAQNVQGGRSGGLSVTRGADASHWLSAGEGLDQTHL